MPYMCYSADCFVHPRLQIRVTSQIMAQKRPNHRSNPLKWVSISIVDRDRPFVKRNNAQRFKRKTPFKSFMPPRHDVIGTAMSDMTGPHQTSVCSTSMSHFLTPSRRAFSSCFCGFGAASVAAPISAV